MFILVGCKTDHNAICECFSQARNVCTVHVIMYGIIKHLYSTDPIKYNSVVTSLLFVWFNMCRSFIFGLL